MFVPQGSTPVRSMRAPPSLDTIAMGTALERSESQTDIARKAAAYDVPAETVDGMDVVAVEVAARRSLAFIREGGGPALLECKTYRFRAHSMFDAELYRDKTEVAEWRERGPNTNRGSSNSSGLPSSSHRLAKFLLEIG